MKTHVSLCLLLTPFWAFSQSQPSTSTSPNTTAMTSNKEIVHQVYEQAMNKRDWDVLSQYISPDFVGIKGKKGPAAFQEPILPLIQAFPDIKWKIEEIFGEGNKLMVKWKWEGTQTAAYLQFPATGKKLSNEGMGIFELKEGKVLASQVITDRLGFLQQLDLVPTDVSLLSPAGRGNQVSFIDKFVVPKGAEREFKDRMAINREFIKTLPGFVGDRAYESNDAQGNLLLLTVAVWQNEEALKNAKELVQVAYKKQGFDPKEMMDRLHIGMDRGMYKELKP